MPHIALAGPDARGSTLDTADAGFALLADDAHESWRHAAADVKKSLGVTVAVHAVDQTAFSPAEPPEWTGAVLIRPDAVIAWKPSEPAGDAAGELIDVMAGLLSISAR